MNEDIISSVIRPMKNANQNSTALIGRVKGFTGLDWGKEVDELCEIEDSEVLLETSLQDSDIESKVESSSQIFIDSTSLHDYDDENSNIGMEEIGSSELSCALCNCSHEMAQVLGDLSKYNASVGFSISDLMQEYEIQRQEQITNDETKDNTPSRADKSRYKSAKKKRGRPPAEKTVHMTPDMVAFGSANMLHINNVFGSDGSVSAHHCCAAWSAGVCQTDSYDLENVDKAIYKALSMRCSHCGRFGASIECQIQNCEQIFHYPCCASAGSFQDIKTMILLCPDHLDHAEGLAGTEACCVLCDAVGDVSAQLFCTSCGRHYHGTCLDPAVTTSANVRMGWQCPECKVCQGCRQPGDDDKMLFCDVCDKGFHLYCLTPRMNVVPKTSWKCTNCRQCVDCGSKVPGGGPTCRWHRNYSLCDRCYQQRKKGQNCMLCNRAVRQLSEDWTSQCRRCSRWVHLECDEESPGDSSEYKCPSCRKISPLDLLNSPFDVYKEKLEFRDGFVNSSDNATDLESLLARHGQRTLTPEEAEAISRTAAGYIGDDGSPLLLQAKEMDDLDINFDEVMLDPNNPLSFPHFANEDGILGGIDEFKLSSFDPETFQKQILLPPRSPLSSTDFGDDDSLGMSDISGSGPSGRGKKRLSLFKIKGKGPSSAVNRKKLKPGKGGVNRVKLKYPSAESNSNKENINQFNDASQDDKSKEEDDSIEGLHSTVVLVSTKDTFTLDQDMCMCCGSFGKDEEGHLISCVQCGQCFHPYCVSVKMNKVIMTKGWRCLDCTVCEGCGQNTDEGKLLLCDCCDVSYHIYCLDPPLEDVPQEGWRCKWCIGCDDCGSVNPGFHSKWMSNYSQCGPCASNTMCPVCNQGYADEELVVKCSNCARWLHGECDGLVSEEDADLAGTYGYHCCLCRPSTNQWGIFSSSATVISTDKMHYGDGAWSKSTSIVTSSSSIYMNASMAPNTLSKNLNNDHRKGTRTLHNLKVKHKSTGGQQLQEITNSTSVKSSATTIIPTTPYRSSMKAVQNSTLSDLGTVEIKLPALKVKFRKEEDLSSTVLTDSGVKQIKSIVVRPTVHRVRKEKEKITVQNEVTPAIVSGDTAQPQVNHSNVIDESVDSASLSNDITAMTVGNFEIEGADIKNLVNDTSEAGFNFTAKKTLTTAKSKPTRSVRKPKGPEITSNPLEFFGSTLLKTSKKSRGRKSLLSVEGDASQSSDDDFRKHTTTVITQRGRKATMPKLDNVKASTPMKSDPMEYGAISSFKNEIEIPKNSPNVNQNGTNGGTHKKVRKTEVSSQNTAAPTASTDHSQSTPSNDSSKKQSSQSNYNRTTTPGLTPTNDLDFMGISDLPHVDGHEVEEIFAGIAREMSVDGTSQSTSQSPLDQSTNDFTIENTSQSSRRNSYQHQPSTYSSCETELQTPNYTSETNYSSHEVTSSSYTHVEKFHEDASSQSSNFHDQLFQRQSSSSTMMMSGTTSLRGDPDPFKAVFGEDPEVKPKVMRGDLSSPRIDGQKQLRKWQNDESLGSDATISPVLYANLMHLNLKTEYPEWPSRARAVARLWRKLPAEQREPFRLRARDNRIRQKDNGRKSRPRKDARHSSLSNNLDDQVKFHSMNTSVLQQSNDSLGESSMATPCTTDEYLDTSSHLNFAPVTMSSSMNSNQQLSSDCIFGRDVPGTSSPAPNQSESSDVIPMTNVSVDDFLVQPTVSLNTPKETDLQVEDGLNQDTFDQLGLQQQGDMPPTSTEHQILPEISVEEDMTSTSSIIQQDSNGANQSLILSSSHDTISCHLDDSIHSLDNTSTTNQLHHYQNNENNVTEVINQSNICIETIEETIPHNSVSEILSSNPMSQSNNDSNNDQISNTYVTNDNDSMTTCVVDIQESNGLNTNTSQQFNVTSASELLSAFTHQVSNESNVALNHPVPPNQDNCVARSDCETNLYGYNENSQMSTSFNDTSSIGNQKDESFSDKSAMNKLSQFTGGNSEPNSRRSSDASEGKCDLSKLKLSDLTLPPSLLQSQVTSACQSLLGGTMAKMSSVEQQAFLYQQQHQFMAAQHHYLQWQLQQQQQQQQQQQNADALYPMNSVSFNVNDKDLPEVDSEEQHQERIRFLYRQRQLQKQQVHQLQQQLKLQKQQMAAQKPPSGQNGPTAFTHPIDVRYQQQIMQQWMQQQRMPEAFQRHFLNEYTKSLQQTEPGKANPLLEKLVPLGSSNQSTKSNSGNTSNEMKTETNEENQKETDVPDTDADKLATEKPNVDLIPSDSRSITSSVITTTEPTASVSITDNESSSILVSTTSIDTVTVMTSSSSEPVVNKIQPSQLTEIPDTSSSPSKIAENDTEQKPSVSEEIKFEHVKIKKEEIIPSQCKNESCSFESKQSDTPSSQSISIKQDIIPLDPTTINADQSDIKPGDLIKQKGDDVPEKKETIDDIDARKDEKICSNTELIIPEKSDVDDKKAAIINQSDLIEKQDDPLNNNIKPKTESIGPTPPPSCTYEEEHGTLKLSKKTNDSKTKSKGTKKQRKNHMNISTPQQQQQQHDYSNQAMKMMPSQNNTPIPHMAMMNGNMMPSSASPMIPNNMHMGMPKPMALNPASVQYQQVFLHQHQLLIMQFQQYQFQLQAQFQQLSQQQMSPQQQFLLQQQYHQQILLLQQQFVQQQSQLQKMALAGIQFTEQQLSAMYHQQLVAQQAYRQWMTTLPPDQQMQLQARMQTNMHQVQQALASLFQQQRPKEEITDKKKNSRRKGKKNKSNEGSAPSTPLPIVPGSLHQPQTSPAIPPSPVMVATPPIGVPTNEYSSSPVAYGHPNRMIQQPPPQGMNSTGNKANDMRGSDAAYPEGIDHPAMMRGRSDSMTQQPAQQSQQHYQMYQQPDGNAYRAVGGYGGSDQMGSLPSNTNYHAAPYQNHIQQGQPSHAILPQSQMMSGPQRYDSANHSQQVEWPNQQDPSSSTPSGLLRQASSSTDNIGPEQSQLRPQLPDHSVGQGRKLPYDTSNQVPTQQHHIQPSGNHVPLQGTSDPHAPTSALPYNSGYGNQNSVGKPELSALSAASALSEFSNYAAMNSQAPPNGQSNIPNIGVQGQHMANPMNFDHQRKPNQYSNPGVFSSMPQTKPGSNTMAGNAIYNLPITDPVDRSQIPNIPSSIETHDTRVNLLHEQQQQHLPLPYQPSAPAYVNDSLPSAEHPDTYDLPHQEHASLFSPTSSADVLSHTFSAPLTDVDRPANIQHDVNQQPRMSNAGGNDHSKNQGATTLPIVNSSQLKANTASEIPTSNNSDPLIVGQHSEEPIPESKRKTKSNSGRKKKTPEEVQLKRNRTKQRRQRMRKSEILPNDHSDISAKIRNGEKYPAAVATLNGGNIGLGGGVTSAPLNDTQFDNPLCKFPLCEPEVRLVYPLVQPFGSKSSNAISSLIGTFGNAMEEGVVDYYAQFPCAAPPVTSSNPPTPPASLPPSPRDRNSPVVGAAPEDLFEGMENVNSVRPDSLRTHSAVTRDTYANEQRGSMHYSSHCDTDTVSVTLTLSNQSGRHPEEAVARVNDMLGLPSSRRHSNNSKGQSRGSNSSHHNLYNGYSEKDPTLFTCQHCHSKPDEFVFVRSFEPVSQIVDLNAYIVLNEGTFRRCPVSTNWKSDQEVFCSAACVRDSVSLDNNTSLDSQFNEALPVAEQDPSNGITMIDARKSVIAVSTGETSEYPTITASGYDVSRDDGAAVGMTPLQTAHIKRKNLELPGNSHISKRPRSPVWMRWKINLSTNKKKRRKALSEVEITELLKQHGVALKADEGIFDLRRCSLCGEKGDGITEGEARLLNFDVDLWIHLNCALWSLEVYESLNGALHNVQEAYSRGANTFCTRCNGKGATIGCVHMMGPSRLRCEKNYHFGCAIKSSCMFFQDKTVLCPQHKYLGLKEQKLPSYAVFRRVYINRDITKQLASVLRLNSEKELPAFTIRVGSLIFKDIGQLLPHQLQTFHTMTSIFPVGFKTTRIFWSQKYLNKRCRYECSVIDKDNAPQFEIAFNNGDEDIVYSELNPKDAWNNILLSVRDIRKEANVLKVFPEFLSGEDLFGLTDASFQLIAESLPGIDTISDYQFRFGRTRVLIAELPLAINPSGCVRSETIRKSHLNRPLPKRSTGTTSSHGLSSTEDNGFSYAQIRTLTMTKAAQYRRLKQEWRNNALLKRSRIQGLGLFAKRDIDTATMVIEYIGHTIRNEVANRREGVYERANRGVYMFRIDADMVVDATMTGGPARYINHSCNPNCTAEIVTIEKEQKIIIISSRRIGTGEELTYDYKFDIEDDQHKLPCLCGADNCRKWMN